MKSLTIGSPQGLPQSFGNSIPQTPIGIAHLDLEGNFCWVSPSLCDWLGYGQAELQQKKLWELIPLDSQAKIRKQLHFLLNKSSPFFSDYQDFLCQPPHNRRASMTVSLISQSPQTQDHLLVILQECHDQQLLEAKLQSAQGQMRAVFEAMQDIVLICTIQKEALASVEIAPTAPLQHQDCIPESVTQTMQFLWQEAPQWSAQLRQVLSTDQSVSFEYSLTIQGHLRWFATNLSPMSPTTVLWVARDISSRKQMEQALFQEKELAQVTLQSIGDAVITTDTQSIVTNINPVAERLTGWNKTEAIGKRLSQVFNIINENSRDTIANPVETVLEQQTIIAPSHHTLLIAKDGTEYAVDDSASPIRARSGHIIGVVLVFNDVTQIRNATQQLSWEANHDPLTQLINRRKFKQLLGEALRDAQQDQQQHVVCFLDLDQFKVINDTCGHNAGDELLCQVTKILQKSIRSADTLARLGGDEFVILLRQCTLAPAQQVAETLRQSIQDFRFSWANQTFQIGVSIGLVQIDHTSVSVESVLNAADSGCYQAKAKGKNRVQIFQANDACQLKTQGEQRWNLKIQDALTKDTFCLYSQTIVPTQHNKNSSRTKISELLLQLRNDQNEIISATSFMPAAERYNLSSAIDQWVIDHVLRYCKTLERRKSAPKTAELFLIRLSNASLKNDEFLSFLRDQLNQSSDLAQHLCFQITETAAIAQLPTQNEIWRELQALGCQFALEQYRGNLASFIDLKSLPIDFLKIDDRLVETIATDSTLYTIVESIQKISHSIGLKTIATGVNTTQIRQQLETIEVDYIQGLEIGSPTEFLSPPIKAN